MAIRKLLSLTLALTACAASAADKDPCDGQDHLSEVRCAAAAVSRLNVKLTEAYQKALDTRPEQDDWDLRKTRDQLRKSQRAWLKYKEENCILIGALEGGSNASIR